MKPPINTVTTVAEPVYWVGNVPAKCEICQQPIGLTIVDARTKPQNRWGIIDLKCHRIYGFGVGVGNGQVYRKQEDGRWLKTEG
jgi:hypothetical protein